MAWLSEVKATEMSNSCLSSLDPTQTLPTLPRAPGRHFVGQKPPDSIFFNLSLFSLCPFHTQDQLNCRILPYPCLSLSASVSPISLALLCSSFTQSWWQSKVLPLQLAPPQVLLCLSRRHDTPHLHPFPQRLWALGTNPKRKFPSPSPKSPPSPVQKHSYILSQGVSRSHRHFLSI